MIAVGRLGDDIGFDQTTQSDASMQRFAAILLLCSPTGADGVVEYIVRQLQQATNIDSKRH
jgi:hypothetical protein